MRCQRREGTYIGNVGESHVDCDIGNPLRHNAVVSVVVSFFELVCVVMYVDGVAGEFGLVSGQ